MSSELGPWEVPSLQDELNRKTLETYQWIVERAERGEFSEAQIKVAVQAVFNVTTGIVPREITAAAEVVEASATANDSLQVVLVGPPSGPGAASKSHLVVKLSWAFGSSSVEYRIWNSFSQYFQVDKRFDCDDAVAAKAKFLETIHSLERLSFKKI